MNVNKIIISLVVIGAVAAIAVGGTIAYFSDTETSAGNIISAGTIGISVSGDGKNEGSSWSQSYTQDLGDMKPGMTRTITFTVQNTGTNPLVLRKQIGNFQLGGTLSEDYCTAQGGTYVGTACLDGSDDLSNVMTYDMSVSLNGDPAVEMIPDSWNIKMSDLKDLWMPLGTLQPGDTLEVTQSYHFDEATGNWAQGDTLSFDISLYAEQLGGVGPNTLTGVVLDNKDTTTWDDLVDGTFGILTWDNAGNYTMRAFGLNNAMTYGVAYYDGSTEILVDAVSGIPTGGELTLSGTYAGFNTNPNAKYWLRPIPWTASSDVNSLFEDNVINQQP